MNDRAELAAAFGALAQAAARLCKALGGDPGAVAEGGASVATDEELDSSVGDPEVKFDPRGWKGALGKGRRFSASAPEFLDMYANALDDMADRPKAGKESYAPDNRRKARLARGWARRIRKVMDERDDAAPPADVTPDAAASAVETSIASEPAAPDDAEWG